MNNPNLQPKKSHGGLIAGFIVFIVLICALIIFYVWDPLELFCKKPQKTCKKPGDCCGEDSKCYGSKCCLELNNSCSDSLDCCNKNICDDKDKKCVKPPLSPTPSPTPPSGTPTPSPSGTPPYKPPMNLDILRYRNDNGNAYSCSQLSSHDGKYLWLLGGGEKPHISGPNKKMCNIYFDDRRGTRCKPNTSSTQPICVEGPPLISPIQCNELLDTDKMDKICSTLTVEDISVGEKFHNNLNHNQGICSVYHEGDSICEKSPESGGICRKSNTKKCGLN